MAGQGDGDGRAAHAGEAEQQSDERGDAAGVGGRAHERRATAAPAGSVPTPAPGQRRERSSSVSAAFRGSASASASGPLDGMRSASVRLDDRLVDLDHLAAGLEQAGHGGDHQDAQDDRQRQPDRDRRDRLDVLAAVDERQGVLVQRLHDQLHADEGQDHRQPQRQVDQPLEQAAEQEVELAQAHQREDVGREDDERLAGQAEDRRDAVEGEDQVRRPERQEDDDHRRPELLAVLDDADLGAVEVLGDRQDLAHPPDERVLLEVVLLAAVPDEVDRGVDEEGAEEVEDPGEPLDEGGTGQDEDPAQDQRDDDADHQGLLLQVPRHPEAGHDDHEDEEVVDRQAVLGQPPGIELGRERARW